MKVDEIMIKQNLVQCKPDDTLKEVVTIMKRSNCGFLPVVNEKEKVEGIITDRDICLLLADKKPNELLKLKANNIMSAHIYSVKPDDGMHEALKQMRLHKIGRLAVINKKRELVGVLSIHALMKKAFSGVPVLDGLSSSGESISKTISALNSRYSKQPAL